MIGLLFQEGAGVRVQIRADQLKRDGKDDSDDCLQVSLLADLQEVQDEDMRAVASDITDMVSL